MATMYRCSGHRRGVCDYESTVKWKGACPVEKGGCGRFYDIMVKVSDEKEASKRSFAAAAQTTVEYKRLATGFDEFDKVLGGGIVPGSATLIVGPPKTGKSTLLVKVADGMGKHGRVMYVSGEQSFEDVAQFVKRIGASSENVELYGNTGELSKIIDEAETGKKPVLVIIDSLQTTYCDDVKADAGTPTQIKAVVNDLTEWAKGKKVAFLLIGHVDKANDMAGPMTLRHLVDAIVFFEPAHEFDEDGEIHVESENRRVLYTSENRYATGPGTVSSMFEMTSEGIKPYRKKSKLELV